VTASAGASVVNFGLGSWSGFICGKKICRVHKNQAVNLLQIPIHGPNQFAFIPAPAVKFSKSLVPTEFEAKKSQLKKNA
jgi:hypothetical protein